MLPPTAQRLADGPNNGAVAIAAITSCTNTSDPRLLVAAGLVARKARTLRFAPAILGREAIDPPLLRDPVQDLEQAATRYIISAHQLIFAGARRQSTRQPILGYSKIGLVLRLVRL